MLRRLEKRILVNLPTEDARKQMLHHHLPPVIRSENNGLDIKTEIEYDLFAKVGSWEFMAQFKNIIKNIYKTGWDGDG